LLGVILGGFQDGGWSASAFLDRLIHTPAAGLGWGLFAGVVWGLGNMLLIAAMALTGMAVAFPLALGLALVVGTFLAYITNPTATDNPLFLFLGLVAVTGAVLLNGLAYKHKQKSTAKVPYLKRGIILAVTSGLLISLFPFPFNFAFDKGVDGYSGAVFMTLGSLLVTVIALPLLMRRPLIPDHKPITIKEYKRAPFRWHAWVYFAGLIWAIGTVFNLVVANRPAFSVAIAYTLGQCAPMIAALWGIFVWKEFKRAPASAYISLGGMFVLFGGGILLLANAAG
jgi:glucose uptake protein